MRRIRSTGCGYSLVPGQSYTCNGVAKLTDMFKTTPTNIFGTEVIRTTRSEEYSNEEWIGNPENLLKGSIDNYAQLPQAFEGFVMTLTPILDMDASLAGPEVPELECRINFNPFAKVADSVLNTTPEYTSDSNTRNDGFLNLYNSVFPNYTKTVYVEAKTQEQLQTESVADNLIYYDMPTYLSGSTVTKEEGIGWVIQPNTDQETGRTSYVSLMAGPGILEPMLDTSFPPIGVDTITGPDIIGDFTMWEFNTIAQWQHTVDTRLNNVRIPPQDYTGLDGLINLENAKNQKGVCENFQIKVSGESVAVIGDSELPTPSYIIEGGVIKVDDSAAFDVMPYAYDPNKASTTTEQGSWDSHGNGIVSGAFDAYLDVFGLARRDLYELEESDDSMIFGATITVVGPGEFPHSTPPDDITFTHLKFEYIGSVVSVETNDVPKAFGEDFKLYEIKQGDCLYEIKTGNGTGGGGSCDCKEYEGPFRLVFDSQAGFGVVGSITDYSIDASENMVYHAGVIYACGASVSWPLTYHGYGAGDVYAHITLEDYSITFDNSPVLYDREAEIEIDPETNQPIMPDAIDCYTVRLGYVDITEAVYVDIPAGNGVYPTEVDSIYEGMIIPEDLPTGVVGSTISSIATVPDSVDDPTIEPREIPIMVYVLVDGQGPAIAIPVENTIDIKQYHTGDIYIDCQEIPEPPEPPEPTEPYEYNGPFKLVSDVERGLVVTGTATDKNGNTQMAGRVYKCGIFEKLAAEGTDLSEGDVFLYVYDDGSIDYGNEDKTIQEEPAQEPVPSNNVEAAEGEDQEEPEVSYCIRLGHADKTDFVVTIPLSNGEEETLTVSEIAVDDIFPKNWQELGIIGTTITAINYDETDPQAENPDPISVAILIPAPEEPGKDPIDPVETTIDTVPFYTIEQYHTGDVYLDCDEEPVPPIVTTYYDGPFKLDKSGSVSCSICPDEGESPNKYSIAGYVSINGTGGAYAGSVRGKSVALTGGTTNVFVNVTPGGASIATEQNTAPNCYSVWLGSITGATISDPAVVEAIVVDSVVYHYVGRTSQIGSYAWDAANGSSVYTAGDNAHTSVNSPVFDTSGSGATAVGTVSALIYRYHDGTQANQMHYGNIHVDGRWT